MRGTDTAFATATIAAELGGLAPVRASPVVPVAAPSDVVAVVPTAAVACGTPQPLLPKAASSPVVVDSAAIVRRTPSPDAVSALPPAAVASAARGDRRCC
jgi:hypothetical protein